MPKYTTYKSIYETAGTHDEARNNRTFSIFSFLHSIGIPKYRLSKAGAAKTWLLPVVIVGLFAGTGVVHAFQSSEPAAEVQTVLVSSGDTLWSIAERHKPESADTRIFISGIKQKNGLNGSEIHAGDELVLPNF